MQWMLDNLAQTLLVIGIVLLIVEIAVLGFSTFFLFFMGLGAISTAVLLYFGAIPNTVLFSMLSVAVLTAFFAGILWKRLAGLQANVDNTRAKSDLIGHTFFAPTDISPTQHGAQRPDYQYSGISWALQSAHAIAQGDEVEVVAVDVGVMTVAKKTDTPNT